MAGRRGRGGAEGTYKLSFPDEYREAYNGSAVVIGILTVVCLVMFIISLYIHQRHWRKKACESSFILLIVISTFFRFVAYLLSFISYVCTLNRATVSESWVLIVPWNNTFFIIAEFTFLAAMYSILHNRLRTVTISEPVTQLISFINWSLFAVTLILGLVWLGDQWAYAALYLEDLKLDYYYNSYNDRMAFEKYSVSDFHVHHARKISASMVVFRFIIQFWLIVLSVIAMVKTPKEGVSAHARKAALVLFSGIASYITAPLTGLILIFKYWKYTPDWAIPVDVSIEGTILVITTVALCIFARMLSPVRAPGQWDLGTTKYPAVATVHERQDYYNSNSHGTDILYTPGIGVGTSFPGGAGRH